MKYRTIFPAKGSSLESRASALASLSRPNKGNLIARARLLCILALLSAFGLMAASPQHIVFNAIPNQILGVSPFPVSGISLNINNSPTGLSVTFTSATTTVCTNSGSLIMVLTSGTCQIQATQLGNGTFGPATPVTQTFTVVQALPSGRLTPSSGSPFSTGGGTFPYGVAVGDFNEDGHPDLAIATVLPSGSGGLTILLGNASGTYSAGTSVGISGSPQSVAIGDFNGDGHLDLALADGISGVAVFLGDGTGNFAAASGSPFATGAAPLFVAVGDFNGDGIEDLVTANPAGNSVSVLLGNTTGGFGFTAAAGSPFTSLFAAGSNPGSVAVGDFNGDGKQDIATANEASNNVSVLLGNGSGGFTAATGSPFAVGTEPASLAVGDFDGNGIQDLAVANFQNSNVTVLLGNGSGGFTPASGSPFAVGTVPSSVAVGDFNGDGIPDLVTANQGSANISLLLGNGSGGFTAAGGSPFTAGSSPNSVAVGDFNSDGLLDVVAANVNSANVTVLLGGLTATTSVLSTSSAPVIAVGASVPLSAAVSDTGSAFTPPTGSTSFFDGGSPLGTAIQNTTPYTFDTAGLALGAHALTATYAGGGGSAASSSNTVNVLVEQSQTITFNALSNTAFSFTPIHIGATSDSGLTVAFTSTTPSVCGIQFNEDQGGYHILLQGIGPCSITASQAGDDTFAPAAPVIQSFIVTQGSQTITFNAIPNQFVGGSPFPVTAQASSGLPVSIASTTGAICKSTGGQVLLIAAGECSLKATQNGNTDYQAAVPVVVNFNAVAANPSGTLTQAGDAIPAGTAPVASVMVDFNGDGFPDIATLDEGSNSLTVLQADGMGDFFQTESSPIDLSLSGTSPVALVAGDFNGDGIPDLAIAFKTNNDVSIFQGDGEGGFADVQDIPVGSSPSSVASADFNEDGFPDLAVTTSGDNHVTLLIFDPINGFVPGTPIAVGSQPSSVVTGDFNGDGQPDLAVANSGDNNVTVLLGSGPVYTPASGSPFATDSDPSTVIAGDFNGDGKLDLATANFNGGDVTVLLGDGTGVFNAAPGSPFATEASPVSLVSADINGDGIADITTANSSGNTIAVLVGNGLGGFAPPVGIVAGNSPYAVVAGDFNQDGILDVAVANNSDNNLSILLGGQASTGSILNTAAPGTITYGTPVPLTLTVFDLSGGFNTPSGQVVFLDSEAPIGTAVQTATPYTFSATGLLPGTHALIASYPGDARNTGSDTGQFPILITVVQASQTITFNPLSNVSFSPAPILLSATATSGDTVTFSSITPLVCTVSNASVTLVTTGTCTIQADQAGDSIYAPAASVQQGFTVLQGTQTITFDHILNQILGSPAFEASAQATSLLPVAFSSITPTVCSMSSGLVTMLTVGTCQLQAAQAGNANYALASSIRVTFLVRQASVAGTLTAASGSPVATGLSPNAIVTGDFNGDGIPDLATANQEGNSVTVLLGSESGLYSPAPGSPFTVGDLPFALVAGDFNGDGIQDLAVANAVDSNLTILLGDGTGRLTPSSGGTIPTGLGPVAIVAGDFNGDGIEDLATANGTDSTLSVLLGNGSGGFTPGTPLTVGSGPVAIAVADFNKDGKEDLASVSAGSNNVSVFTGNGSGGFTALAGSPFTVGANPASIAVGDFNGDGKPDMAVTNEGDGTVTVLLANASNSFTVGSPITVVTAPEAIMPGDFNGDGIADLAVTSLSNRTVTVLLGDGTGGFTVGAGSPFSTDLQPNSLVVADLNGDGFDDIATANVASNDITILQGALSPTNSVLTTTSPLSIAPGLTVPLTLNVADTGSAFLPLTGTVTVRDGGTVIGTATPTGSAYTFTTAALPSGTHVLTAVYGGGSGSATSTSNAITIQAVLAQTISFGTLSDVTIGVSPFTIGATATSGLGVTFNSNSPTICTVDVDTVTVAAVGLCSITAQQPGDPTYAPAPTVTQTFNVNNPTPQTISFFPIPNQIFGISPITVAARASSGLPVTLASQTPAVCTTASGLVTIVKGGGCTILATQPGNATFAAAPAVSQNFTVTQAAASGTFAPTAGSPLASAPPYATAVGDFNGDGIPDLATANLTANTVTVLIGDGSGGFTATADGPYTVGNQPDSIVVGDFNGDGIADIATSNFGDNNVSVLFGNISGGFTAATTGPFLVGTHPEAVRIGDFNGDGTPDLVTANFGSNNVTVLLGDGSGGFSAASFAVGTGPQSVAVGDFDGNGKQDLAVGNFTDNTVTILMGDGAGGFTAPLGPFGGGTGPASIAIADFNLDGAQDLAVADNGGANITVLLGTGTGGFNPATGSPFLADTGPYGVAVGDFNGDGIPDLASANFTADTVSVLLGDGHGGFTTASGGPFLTGTGPRSVVVADFKGNGTEDLAVGDYTSSDLTILLGTLAGTTTTLSAAPPASLPAGGNVSLSATVSETTTGFNAPTGTVTFFDGATNLGSAVQTTSPFQFITPALALGSHTFTASYAGGNGNAASLSNTDTIQALTPQSITFNSLSDVVFASGNVTLTATASSGLGVTYISTTTTVCTVSVSTVTLASVGVCSITASQPGGGTFAAATNVAQNFNITQASQSITFNALSDAALSAGTVTLTATASSGLRISYTSSVLTVCTVSNNIVTLVSPGTCSITANQVGNGNYAAAAAVSQSFNVTSSGLPQTITFDPVPNQLLGTSPFVLSAQSDKFLPVTFASLNNEVCDTDGDMVVLLLTSGTCTIQASQAGNGTISPASTTQSFSVSAPSPGGSFTAATGSPYTASLLAQAVALGDFNNDGIQDMAIADAFSNGKVSILLGNASGGFSVGTAVTVGSTPYAVAIGDFNGDGNLDFATANQGANTVSVMLGSGNGRFSPGTAFSVGTSPEAIAVGDFNGDGIQDLAVGNGGDNTVTVYLGDGSGGFSAGPGGPFSTGVQPRSIVVGDFNQDGIQDLATANQSNNNVTVLLGTGIGTFIAAPGSPYAVGTSPTTLVVGDFNGDGAEDLAVANNAASGSISVLLGTADGSGSFTVPSGSPYGSGKFASVAVSDINGDGIPDLVASNVTSGAVAVLLGDGSGAFTQSATTFTAGSQPNAIITGDFNNDGIVDFATVNSGGSNVSVMLGAQSTTSPQTITFTQPANVPLSSDSVTLTATASSELLVSFTSTTLTVCGVSESVVSLLTTGTCTITASQGGNGSYSPAPNVTLSFTITPNSGPPPPPAETPQTISFGPIGNVPVGSPSFAITATASSGLPVTFVSVGGCSVSGNSVTVNSAGTCSITAYQIGNSTFAVATPVTQSFLVFAPITITTSSLPSGAVNRPYGPVNLAATGGAGALTWSVNAGSLPGGLSLSGASIGGTPTTAGTFSFSVKAVDSAGDVAAQGLAITINPAVTITTTSISAAIQGIAYSQSLTASGGTGAYTWTVSGGSLPSGISLSSGGALSGTASVSGSFSFTAQVSDGLSTASQGLTLSVGAPLSVTSSSSLPNGITGTAYSSGFAAKGGTGGPYTWSVSSGSLPSGLALSTGGVLGGNPSASGTFAFTVQAADGVSPPASLGASITVFTQLSITTTSLPNGTLGAAYPSVTLTAKGGTGAVTWSASGLPAGLAVSSTGALSGTPTAAGPFTASVIATDAGSGQSLTSAIPLTVVPASTTLQVSPSTLSTGAGAGSPISASFIASGGTPPYNFSATGLPAGVTLSAAGVLSGSSSAAGTYTSTVTVNDSAATPATVTAQLTVQILGLSTSDLPPGAATVLYTASFGASGGTPPYVFSASGLPAGFSLSGNGNLSGTAATAGSISFTLQVSDRSGLSSSRSYSLTTGKAPASVTAGGLAPGAVGTPYSQTLNASGGTSPYAWSLVSGALPPGLSLAASGTISGIPTVPGTTQFGVEVKDASGGVASGGESIGVAASPVSLTTADLPSGIVNFSYGPEVLDITGGVAPYTFAISDGAMPPGLSLAGGAVSGIPTTAGTFPFTVTATDSAGSTANLPTSVVIRPPSTDLVLLEGSVSFSVVKGETAVSAAQSVGVQSAVVSNPINYTVTVSPASSWLSVSGGTTTPGVLSVGLTTAALSLPAGSSQATVTLTCTSDACTGKTQSVAVSVNVTSPPPELSVESGLIAFTSASTPPQAQSQPLEIQNIGGGTLNIGSVSCEASWCSVGSFPATLADGPPTQVTVTGDPTGLASGFYRTAVDVVSAAGSASVPVTFFITQTASMTLAPQGTQFSMPAGGTPGNSTGSFAVSVVGNTVNWSAAVLSGAPWLTLNTASGTSSSGLPGTVSFSVNSAAASLAPQAYYATIEVTSAGAANSPQDFQVILNVGPASQPVQLSLAPSGLEFVTTAGTAPGSQSLSIYADSVTPVGYQAAASTASGAKWLAVSPAVGQTSASAPGQATVSIDPTGLVAGIYSGGVSYATSDSGIRTVNVTLIVETAGGGAAGAIVSGLAPNAETPKDACSPTTLVPTQTGLVNSFSAPASWPTPLSILLADDCGNVVNKGQVVATFSNGDAPLAFTVANAATGLYSATWTPRNSASQVTINARATLSGLTSAIAQLSGAVVPNATPTITPNGVVHAFDPSVGGALAPGTIVAIYGTHLGSIVSQPSTLPLPTKLNGTTVLIGGMASPLFYVSPGQINVQIPFELNPATQYQVIVNANGALTTPQAIQLTQVDPGLDTFPDGTLVAVHAADGTLISANSPAQPGEYAVLFLLGMGATSNPVASGDSSSSTTLSETTDPPTLTFNGNPVPVSFAGLAPGFVGLYQLNVQIPAGTPGGNLAVTVSQDGVAGNSGILPIAY